ncbi:nuclear transport factor 2 family protein [uncultured Roseobacter sp.]|uniref:nuclear transport factor 2 family protein n=1 Tax=uncultured Roseobacter sp. TaxID=114847 RepID=UPI00260A9E93|nr:nuclear transport factor 2 family protein [uncultured Roseobacter sp.]
MIKSTYVSCWSQSAKALRALALLASAILLGALPQSANAAEWPAKTELPSEIVRPDSAESLPPSDAMAVHETVIRVYLAEDSRDFEALGQLVTDDLLHAHSVFGTVRGRDAFVAFVRDGPQYFDRIRHQAMNIVTRKISETEAEALSYILVISIYPDQEAKAPAFPRIIGHGVVRDRLLKQDGRWRIAERIYDQMAVSAAFISNPEDREHFGRSLVPDE